MREIVELRVNERYAKAVFGDEGKRRRGQRIGKHSPQRTTEYASYHRRWWRTGCSNPDLARAAAEIFLASTWFLRSLWIVTPWERGISRWRDTL